MQQQVLQLNASRKPLSHPSARPVSWKLCMWKRLFLPHEDAPAHRRRLRRNWSASVQAKAATCAVNRAGPQCRRSAVNGASHTAVCTGPVLSASYSAGSSPVKDGLECYPECTRFACEEVTLHVCADAYQHTSQANTKKYTCRKQIEK